MNMGTLKTSSSFLAKQFAAMLDALGCLWVDEIGTWVIPQEDGTHKVASSDEMREALFDFMDEQHAGDGFTDGKLTGTFKMMSLKQKLKRQRLHETHLAFTDGKLNCSTFEFEPFPPPFDEKKTYSKNDRIRFGKFDWVLRADTSKEGIPPSSSSSWDRLQGHASLALMRLDMAYDEAVNGKDECPEFLKFLSQVFVGEDGVTPSDELLSVVYPMCGYFLMPHLKANKIFMLAGPTASNGKSTFMKIIEELMPEGTVDSKKFNEFASVKGPNWGKAELVGKRLVLCSEESSRDIDAGRLKEFADGMSAVQAERKFQQPFSFFPTFKLLAAFNSPPEFDNVDQGTLRRFFYIPCNAEFDGSVSVDEIKERVLAERQAILAWMVRQAKALHEKKWLFPMDGKLLSETKEVYMSDQNSVLAFCRETYEPTTRGEGKIVASEIYDEYVAWCGRNGYRNPFGRRKFGIAATSKLLGDNYSIHGTRYRSCRRKSFSSSQPPLTPVAQSLADQFNT